MSDLQENCPFFLSDFKLTVKSTIPPSRCSCTSHGTKVVCMWKRVIELVVGALALPASGLALIYGLAMHSDFNNPGEPVYEPVLGMFLFLSLAGFGLVTGLRMLIGRSGQSRPESWIRPTLLGIGSFLPGFTFSLPLTLFFALRVWPRNPDPSAGLIFSLCAGVASSIACFIVLLRRRKRVINPGDTRTNHN